MFFIIGGDGKEYGPVPAEQIQTWIATGRANLETRARIDGTQDWKRLGDFVEFGAQPGITPPPLNPTTPPTYAPVSASSVGVASAVAAIPYEPADRGTRLVARIIDWLLSILACAPGIVLMGPAFVTLIAATQRGERPDLAGIGTGGLILGGLLTFVLSVTLLIIQIVMLSTRGQTIGKRIMSIKIVRLPDNSEAGFVNAWLLRSFVVGLISFFLNFLFWLGSIFSIVDACFIFRDDRRCIHDLIANTQVVKVKKP